jgi:predicted site-specific integrase-resolvase
MVDEHTILKGWKEIAACLQVSEATARRWVKRHHLPVCLLPGPVAVREHLIAWILARSLSRDRI